MESNSRGGDHSPEEPPSVMRLDSVLSDTSYTNIARPGGFSSTCHGFASPSQPGHQPCMGSPFPPQPHTMPVSYQNVAEIPLMHNGRVEVTETGDTHVDEEMTTLVSSTGPSRNPSISHQANGQNFDSSCPAELQSVAHNANNFSVSCGFANIAQSPGCSLPSFREMLGPTLLFHAPGQANSQIAEQEFGYNQAPLEPESHHHASVMTPSSSSDARTVSSSLSTSTIRAPVNIAERRSELLMTLYYTCLDASATYIRSLPPIGRRRHQYPRYGTGIGTPQEQGAPYHPYRSNRTARPHPPPHRTHEVERTLMDHISRIATHVWRRARNDLMAPHQAEAVAVRDMKNLYVWGEVLIRGVADGSNIGCSGVQAEDILSDLGDADCVTRAGEVAKQMCQWLRDRQAWDICDKVDVELKDLMRTEQAEHRSVSVDESLNDFGNIR